MFKIGDKVTMKRDFTIGVGTIVTPPAHIVLSTDEVDVQWPKKRRFELTKNLNIVSDVNFVAPCPICGITPAVHRSSMGTKLFDGYVVSCGGDLEKGWHYLKADLDNWNSMFKFDSTNPLVKFVDAETKTIIS